ncbi:MAG: hypothetical protein OZ921_19255, partial [Sorangiineae bacterium]|nr:hypothetical protein [Sorangiineae bacterium]
MTERDSAGLPKDAERLLAGWAATTRDAATLEELTRRTDARCAETAPGSTPDELLAAPLPESASDGSLAAPAGASPDSLPAPRASSPGLAGMSLAALAASVSAQTRPETEADLARESLSLASQSRPSAREIAASLSARRAAPSVPPAPSAQVPASTAAPAQAAPLPAAAASGRSGWLIGGAALLALAAALMLMLGRRAPAPSATAIVLANASAPAASAPPELLEPPDQGAATPSPPG